jgi:hypothetical protein
VTNVAPGSLAPAWCVNLRTLLDKARYYQAVAAVKDQ